MPTVQELLGGTTPAAPEQSNSNAVMDALGRVGDIGLGALATVGNFLDLPGSSVRDLLGGENPADQWLTPFSSENRTSGRDLMTKLGLRANRETGITGWASDPLEGVLDLAGFGIEVATDPFGPLASAAAKSGRVAKLAGKVTKAAPGVAKAGALARTIFDPLAKPSKAAIYSRLIEPTKRYGAALFDWRKQGVTDPIVQDMAGVTRAQMRAVTDAEQSAAALFFLKARDIGWSLEVDDSLDMADPANLMHPQSPARVQGKRDSVRRYLEEVDQDLIPSTQYTAGDVVTVGSNGTPRAVEYVQRTPNGDIIKLYDDATQYADNQLNPLWVSAAEAIPKELEPSLRRYKTALAGSRDRAVALGANIAHWIDPYVEFAARKKGEFLSHLESRLGKSPVFWRRFRGLADALANPGNREQMLGGFREGTPGINRLYTDRAVEPRLRQLHDLTGGAPVIGADGATHSVIPGYVGIRHITPIAEGIGMDPEEMWRAINNATYRANPFNATVRRTNLDTFEILENGTPVGSVQLQFMPDSSGGLVADLRDMTLTQAARGRKMSPFFFEAVVRDLSQNPIPVNGGTAAVSAIRTEAPAALADKVFKPLGFQPQGLSPAGNEILTRDIFSSRAGVPVDQAFPRLLPQAVAQRGIDLLKGQMVNAVASGTMQGAHVGNGRWSSYTDIRTNINRQTSVPITYNMLSVDGAKVVPSPTGTPTYVNRRSPLDITGQEMHMVTPRSLASDQVRYGFDDLQRDLIDEHLARGEDVFIGHRKTGQGKTAELVILRPTRIDRLSKDYGKFVSEFNNRVQNDPLLFSEAATDEMYWHIRRNYGDRVDQWMADVGPDGVQAMTEMGDALSEPMSIGKWHQVHSSLMQKVMTATGVSGAIGLSSNMEALLQLDEPSLIALGFTQGMRDMLDQARSAVNGVRTAANSTMVLNQTAQIPLLDRYAALAGDMAALNERRVLPMFSNDPVVDAADYISRNKQLSTYLERFIDLAAQMVRTTKQMGASAIRTGDVQFGDQFTPGRTLGELLDPSQPGSLFGSRVNREKIVEHIHNKLVFDGVYRASKVRDVIDKQIAEIMNVRMLDDTASELRTFNEILSFDVLPEIKPISRALANMGTAFKAYQLSWPATAMRDGAGSLFNAAIMSDLNPATAIPRYGRKALDFARGAPIDPGTVPEVMDLMARLGLQNNAQNRGRAFQALWAAHHRAPSRHVNVEFADVSDLAKSGVAEAVLSAVPREGRGAVGQNIRQMLQTEGTSIVDDAVARWQEGGGLQNLNPLSASGPLGSRGMFSLGNIPGRWMTDEYGKPIQSRRSNIFLGAMNDLRGTIDTTVRAIFIQDKLAKGMSLTEAFRESDRILTNSDPRNFTRFESKWLKTLMPFYGFMRQSTPLFLRELATNPGGKLGMTVRAARLGQGDERDYVPFQYQDTMSIPLGQSDDGSLRYLTSLGLMHEDAIKYAGNILQGDLRGVTQKLLSSGNPAIKWLIEYSTNTSLYSQGPMGGRRLDDLDPTLGRIAVNVGLRDMPQSNRPTPVGGPLLESLVAASPASRALSTIRTLTNPSDRATAVEKVLRLLSGVRVEAVSPEQIKRDIQDRLNAEQIAAGARPLSIASGIANLKQQMIDEGDLAGAERMAAIEKVLSLIRKDLKGGSNQSNRRRMTVNDILSASP